MHATLAAMLAVRAVVVALVAYLLSTAAAGAASVVLELRATTGAAGTVRWTSTSAAAQEQSVAYALPADGRWHDVRVRVPADPPVALLRIVPDGPGGQIEVRRVRVSSEVQDVDLRVTTLRIALPSPAPRSTARIVATRIARAAAWGIAWAVVDALVLLVLARRGWRPLDRLARALSDEGALVVDRTTASVACAIAAAAALYVALGLNQSSIGMWETTFGAAPVAERFELGTPREIRSDEYGVMVPWTLAQLHADGTLDNPALGGERAALLASVPVRHATLLAQPKFWGFFLFDVATGFSWWWAYKTFALWGACCWLFLLLTRGRLGLSVVGASWIYTSSFTQWWFSSTLAEILIAFAAVTIGAHYLLFATRPRFLVLGALATSLGTVSVVLNPYPPFSLPLAWLGVALLVGRLLEPGALALVRAGGRRRLAAVAGALVGAAALLGIWVHDAAPAIQAMTSTAYPGVRIAPSGGLSFARTFYGFFEVWRFDETTIPARTGNASEASSFLLLAPAALAVVRWRALAAREHALVTSLACYFVVVCAWVGLPLPPVLEAPLQMLGWSWSESRRALLGLGLASIMLCIVVSARAGAGALPRARGVRAVVVVAFAIAIGGFGVFLAREDPAFFTPLRIVAGAAAALVLAAGAAFGSTALLALGVAATAAGPMCANPLNSGLDALLEQPVLVAARRASTGPSDRWLVIGQYSFAQGLKAHGLDVVGGSWIVPDRAALAVIDPKGASADVWNRYAHVRFRSNPDAQDVDFRLRRADAYEVWLDVCGPIPRALGVTHVAYTLGTPNTDLRCLTPIPSPRPEVRLYRLKAFAPIPAASP